MTDYERKMLKLNRVLSMLGSHTVSMMRLKMEKIEPKVTEDELDVYIMILSRCGTNRRQYHVH